MKSFINKLRNKGKSLRMKKAVAVIASVVAIACAVGVGYAWYHATLDATSNELNIKSDSELISILEYKIYKSAEASDENGVLSLKGYDSIFGRNSKTAVYVVVPVGGSAVKSGSAINFEIDCNASLSVGNSISDYFSNVAQVRCTPITAADALAADYESLKTKFTAGNAVYTFASYTSDDVDIITGGSKAHINIAMSGYTAADIVNFVFEIDYNKALVNSYLNNHGCSIKSGRLDKVAALELNEDNDITMIVATTN